MFFDPQNLSGLTPVMKQYATIKIEHPDAILLFQVGDFYELFFDDAKKVSDFLGITLTKRGELNGQPIPLCGFPVHAVEHYIPRLVKGGFKIALCDQLETAVTGKMVARGVTNVLTPGMLVSENLLDAKSNSYLFSFFPTKAGYGLLFSELLTSQLHATVLPFGSSRQLEAELFRFLPDEVLLLQNRSMHSYESFFKQRGFFTTSYGLNFDTALIDQETTWLAQQFDQQSFKTLQEQSSLLYATILWKKYVQKNQQKALEGFRSITLYEPEAFLMLDGATQKNLDIVKNSFDGSRSHTLFSLVDKAVTPMGSRMIKRWLLSPLMQKDIIQARQNVVQEFLSDCVLFKKVQNLLSGCGDMQRIVGRIALDRASVRDFAALGSILSKIPELKKELLGSHSDFLHAIASAMKDFSQLQRLLEKSCNDDGNIEGIIKAGFHEGLDRMRDLVQNSSSKVLQLEQQEIERTGITSLKIRHNNLAGYYIEITKTHLDIVPADYIEQQSLVGRKRFTMKALQVLQLEILQAQHKFVGLEKEIFEGVKAQVKDYVYDLRSVSQSVANVDGLVGFAKVAHEWGWVKPEFNTGRDIIIESGKHPVVAAGLLDTFIANDTTLTDEQSLWIVTGPNMGGKSTYLRQVALICLLAQTGSFVPARRAKLPILDRIFTRIGAGDFLAQGKSTFLVEMEETAQILQQATKSSLVILDEVGRGTSTYDGLALAQAIVEYIFHKIGARCLFATHYHELTDLQSHCTGIVSYYADSVRTEAGIVFLHKIVAGKADGSFGLEVAKLAHIPQEVVARAAQILAGLHQGGVILTKDESDSDLTSTDCGQLNSIDPRANLIVERLKQVDFDNLSPKKAFDLLWEFKDLMP
ncbi:MAG: DNA mismatch repair protein MutS [Candidatus Dependentiae bacterium]|nr:DNA mismatch repair protein MutS [Candidatus Dependentiae bacterium]